MMKRKIGMVSLLMFTSQLFAGYCGNLGLTITNETDHECVLRHTRIDMGVLQDQAPTIIPSHSTTPTFYLEQNGVGIGALLDYRCDKKVALFYSYQDYCGFSAGKIKGWNLFASDLGIDNQMVMGSYWAAIPGQINWRIHE